MTPQPPKPAAILDAHRPIRLKCLACAAAGQELYLTALSTID